MMEFSGVTSQSRTGSWRDEVDGHVHADAPQCFALACAQKEVKRRWFTRAEDAPWYLRLQGLSAKRPAESYLRLDEL